MKNKAGALSLLAAAFIMSAGEPSLFHHETILAPADKETLRKDAERKRKEKQGIQKFYYNNGTHVVEARNQKNADRKARNLGYI